jgi:hypothetical protein
MTYAHAAAQDPLDTELDEWDRQRAQEDERRESAERAGSTPALLGSLGAWGEGLHAEPASGGGAALRVGCYPKSRYDAASR